MMCFRDRTYCTAKCQVVNCEIRMTSKVWEDAVKWWGNENAPIAVSDYSSRCEDFIPMNDEEKEKN